MRPIDQTELRDEIARLELRIEDLSVSIEKSRKAILASKVAIAGGVLLTLALVLGVVVQPLAIVIAIAGMFGGTVGFGANVSTVRQDEAALQAAAAERAELISRLDLREIGQGTSLSYYQ